MSLGEAVHGRLRRLILAQPRAPIQVLWGVGAAGAATALRLGLPAQVAGIVPFIFYYPAVAGSGAFLGAIGGVACLLTGVALYLAQALLGEAPRPMSLWPAGFIYILCSSFILWLTAMMRRFVRELHQAEQQHAFLLEELQHRVKNTLAVVQAIATQTLRSTDGPARAEKALNDRLVALGQAHSLLGEEAWRGARLRELLTHTLEPFLGDHQGRVELDGEDLALPADTVVGLALCLHELATNATKYGALSAPTGRVTIQWQASGGRIRLEWREDGGPPVAAPKRKGFGSRILQRGITGRARPKLAIDYRIDGLVWRAEFDVVSAPEG